MAGDNNDRFFEDSDGSDDKEEEFVDEDSKMDEAAEEEEDGETQQFSTSTQSTHKSKATPSKSKKDKYSEANVKARTNADGSVIPVTKPKLLPNGKYQRPKGRGRNGCSWDEDRGKFLWLYIVLDLLIVVVYRVIRCKVYIVCGSKGFRKCLNNLFWGYMIIIVHMKYSFSNIFLF